jgi:hypothetical protein
MSIKVAINGFGRIGRCTLRAIYEQGLQNEFEVVAINASGDLATNAHLLKYDTTHGRFATSVETEGENVIIIDGKKIPFYSTKDPEGRELGQPRRGRAARMHRRLHHQGQGPGPARPGRQARADLRPGRRRRGHHHRHGRERRTR